MVEKHVRCEHDFVNNNKRKIYPLISKCGVSWLIMLCCVVLLYRAKTHLDAAIACDQSCDRAYALRADCYKAMNQPALAVNDYSKAIRIKPNLPQYWLFRVRTCVYCLLYYCYGAQSIHLYTLFRVAGALYGVRGYPRVLTFHSPCRSHLLWWSRLASQG